MLSRHMTDYPTVEEVLALAPFSGCRTLGGSAGCQRRVRGVNLTDTPDYARWLSPEELLLTTGFALAGDEAAIEALLPTAAERGLAGVGIKPGRFLPDPLPGSLAREADRLGLPLIALPGDALRHRGSGGTVPPLGRGGTGHGGLCYPAAGSPPHPPGAPAGGAAGDPGPVAVRYGQPAADGPADASSL